MNPQKEKAQYQYVEERVRMLGFERTSVMKPDEPVKIKQARLLVSQYDTEIRVRTSVEEEHRRKAIVKVRFCLKELSFTLSYTEMMDFVHAIEKIFIRHQQNFTLLKENENIEQIIEQYFKERKPKTK